MKVVCSVFIAILFAHLLCDGQCLAESLNAANQPPCHRHSGSSSDKPHNDLCTQGPVLEGKANYQPVAVLPELPVILPHLPLPVAPQLMEEGPSGVLPSPLPISVLRI